MKSLIGLLIFCLFLSSCDGYRGDFSNQPETFEIFCGAEEVSSFDKNLMNSSNSSFYVKGANARTKEKARTGQFGLQCNPRHKYVMGVNIDGVKTDDYFVATIWRYGSNSDGILAAGGIDHFSHEAIEQDEKGWEKLRIQFYIPPNLKTNEIKVFFWNAGEETIYVDDFTIEKRAIRIAKFDENPLNLLINEANSAKLDKLRKKAFDDKIIVTDDFSFVKGILSFDGDYKKAKLRFKGDWLDHIRGYKWSFRIALKGGETWRGMRTFNIQSPSTRNHLSEWLAHKIAEKEDILTTRYDFIPVVRNRKNVGLYVYEEHFEKQLIESKNRREGPILKFTEDQFWDAIKFKSHNNFSSFASAKIVPYKFNRTIKDQKLKSQFLAGKNLLNAFKNKTASVGEIFDLDKMAKYIAFIDFVKGYHGLRWHNIRFYYNPVLSRLEPIAYDLNEARGPLEAIPNALLANTDLSQISSGFNGFDCSYSLFSDSLFYANYLHYVDYFSQELYLTEIYNEFNEELKLREQQLQYEFPEYVLNRQTLFDNQRAMRMELEELNQLTFKEFSEKMLTSKFRMKKLKLSDYPSELIEKIVHIHKESDGLKILNYTLSNLEIMGYLVNKSEYVKDDHQFNVPPYYDAPGELSIPDIGESVSHVFVKVMTQDEICSVKVLEWESPSDSLNIIPELNWPDWIIDEGENLRIKKGDYSINSPISIPKNKNCIIEEGVTVDFTNGAYLWSYSSIDFMGTKENPIVFKSTDNSAMGITIIQASKLSHVNYTSFVGFNTFKKGDWELTGAVNWYESEVVIRNCNFKENLCEDALNIIRSNFDISGCTFHDIYADAFDADFCTGIIANSEFTRVGNDAIDFSGSQVEIVDLKISETSDKAISGGEASSLVVSNCLIDKVNIAIASKDNSDLKLENIEISNCLYGLVAYIKKKEYGPAKIHAVECVFENVEQIHLIERKSTFTLNGKQVLGDSKNLQKLFY